MFQLRHKNTTHSYRKKVTRKATLEWKLYYEEYFHVSITSQEYYSLIPQESHWNPRSIMKNTFMFQLRHKNITHHTARKSPKIHARLWRTLNTNQHRQLVSSNLFDKRKSMPIEHLYTTHWHCSTIDFDHSEGVSGFTSSDETSSLIFTLSESLTLLIRVMSISTVVESYPRSRRARKTYTATFTPSIGGESFKSIFVNADSFQDQVGHLNTASNVFHWTFMCDDGYHKGEFSWNVVPGKMCHSSYTNIEGVTDIAVCKEACIDELIRDRSVLDSVTLQNGHSVVWRTGKLVHRVTTSYRVDLLRDVNADLVCWERMYVVFSNVERISHFLFNYSEDSVVSLT